MKTGLLLLNSCLSSHWLTWLFLLTFQTHSRPPKKHGDDKSSIFEPHAACKFPYPTCQYSVTVWCKHRLHAEQRWSCWTEKTASVFLTLSLSLVTRCTFSFFFFFYWKGRNKSQSAMKMKYVHSFCCKALIKNPVNFRVTVKCCPESDEKFDTSHACSQKY